MSVTILTPSKLCCISSEVALNSTNVLHALRTVLVSKLHPWLQALLVEGVAAWCMNHTAAKARSNFLATDHTVF